MKKLNFNKNWTVQKLVSNLTEEFLGNLDAQKIIPVTLPHDAMIFEKRDPKNPAGGACGFYPGGDYEYTRHFHVEEPEAGQTFILEFEGIYNRGYIYVNGALAGSVQYGYTGIRIDITPYLHFGGDNLITVKAINSDVPNSRWYTGSGIYRPVFLYKGGPIRIDPDGLRVSTPEVSGKLAAVKVETTLCYDAKIQKTVSVKSEILNSEGCAVAGETSLVSLFGQAETLQTQRIYVQNPALWSDREPNLYCCRVTVLDGEEVLDTAESTFGIRKLELDPVDGLKLNGEKILLRGGCIHHDNGPVGAAAFDRAEERRIELLKEAGFNSVRTSHNSTSRALLDACDRLGMLVMEESYDTWCQAKSQYDSSLVFTEHWEKDLEDIVRKDFNHPSVFMYSIGNEITDLHTPDGAKWSRRLACRMRELDPTRYVTNAINGMTSVMGDIPAVMMDLGLLTQEQLQVMMSGASNGPSSGGDINEIMTALLGRMNEVSVHPLIEERLSEAYGTLDLVGLNYMRGTYEKMDAAPNRVFYGSETLPSDIDLNWKKVRELPSCIGDHTWTAWDYIGEAGIGIVTYQDALTFKKPYPAYLAYCGDLDITGYRRPASYFREIVFGLRELPYIAVQLPAHYGETAMCTPWSTPEAVSSWTWKGYEGKRCKVEVYSDAPEVELFINEKSVGKLPAGEAGRFRAVFDTAYEPGEIRAAAYYADGAVKEYMLKTADDKVVLDVKADRSVLAADGLAYVNIELRDASGILNTANDRKVKLSVEGAGQLQGFGSADPFSEENFFDSERTTYYGRALAVIRAGETEGTITLCAEADGAKPVSVTLQVK